MSLSLSLHPLCPAHPISSQYCAGGVPICLSDIVFQFFSLCLVGFLSPFPRPRFRFDYSTYSSPGGWWFKPRQRRHTHRIVQSSMHFNLSFKRPEKALFEMSWKRVHSVQISTEATAVCVCCQLHLCGSTFMSNLGEQCIQSKPWRLAVFRKESHCQCGLCPKYTIVNTSGWSLSNRSAFIIDSSGAYQCQTLTLCYTCLGSLIVDGLAVELEVE